MTKLLQFVCDYCGLTPTALAASPLAGGGPQFLANRLPVGAHGRPRRIAVNEEVVGYRSLIDLRQQLAQLDRPETTTVVLVLDERHPVHLPSLVRRDDRAYRLIVTSPSRSLLGTTSAGDLALLGQSWGWELVCYEGDLALALRAARETTASDEQLLVLVPAWQEVSIISCG